MSIAHYDPTAKVKAPEQLATSSSPEKFAVYDNEVTPTYSLEASLQGSPWTTDGFFRQILSTADSPKELDLSLAPPFQYYEKIELLEILVNTALNSSYDAKKGIMTTTGEATVYSFLRPNVSDYFTAKANLGRLALFKIDEVVRLTHEKESVHRIRYSLVEEMTPDNKKLANLELKTSVRKVFSKSRLIENLNPILLKERFVSVRRLGGDFRAIANDYWRTFYKNERGSLFLPGQDSYIYDPFLAAFFNKVVGSDVVPDKQLMIFLSEGNDPIYAVKNIWYALEHRGIENLVYSNLRVKMVTPTWFDHVSLSRSAYFANTDFTLYPDEYDRSASIVSKPRWGTVATPGFRVPSSPTGGEEVFNPSPTTNARGDYVDPAENITMVAGMVYPLYNNVMAGDSYIFKPCFFDEVPTSVLEILLLDYIRREALDLDQLAMLIKFYPKMPRLEQFYYGPMLMVLIHEALRGAHA